jgi:hypothetical protein
MEHWKEVKLKTVLMGEFLPRNKYPGSTTVKSYFSKNRSELQKAFGGATTVLFHVRVYDRSSSGSPSLDFEVLSGCLRGENPADALRAFSQTPASQTPSLPFNNANMTSVPDDGTFTVTPGMGLMDVCAKVSGSAATWIEFEIWFTAIYA